MVVYICGVLLDDYHKWLKWAYEQRYGKGSWEGHTNKERMYHRTKDILHVKERLGHRSINSTLVYMHLVNFESDEFHVRVAKNLKQDK